MTLFTKPIIIVLKTLLHITAYQKCIIHERRWVMMSGICSSTIKSKWIFIAHTSPDLLWSTLSAIKTSNFISLTDDQYNNHNLPSGAQSFCRHEDQQKITDVLCYHNFFICIREL
jgi:hypothetical protein